MKKVLTVAVLCLLTLATGAQTKKTVTTQKVTKHYVAQPSMMYFGIGVGDYVYSGTREFTDNYGNTSESPYEYHSAILGVQGGYLYSLFGDMNKSFTPYVGGEGILGIAPWHVVGLAIQASAVAGVMIGSPSFRLDIRVLPQLTYFGDGEYEYGGHYRYGSTFRPNIALRAGVWINRFNFYLQYNNIVSVGIGWRF